MSKAAPVDMPVGRRPKCCRLGHPITWVLPTIGICDCRHSYVWQWNPVTKVLKVEVNLAAREMAAALLEQKGDEPEVLDTQPIVLGPVVALAPNERAAEAEALKALGAAKVVAQRLPAERLTCDPIRPIRPYWVRQLARTFDQDKLGVLYISKRADGTLVVIEGNHRVMTVRSLLLDKLPLSCLVYEGLSLAQEAALFNALENRLHISKIDQLRARAQAQEPLARGIADVIEREGLALGPTTGGATPRIQAAKQLELVYQKYGAETLAKAIRTAKQAWPGQRSAFDGSLLTGLAAFFDAYGAAADASWLATRLAPHPATQIRQEGRTALTALGGSGAQRLPEAIARVLLYHYNHRRTAHRLPEWPK